METVQTISSIEGVVIVFRGSTRPLDICGVEDGNLDWQIANVAGLIQIKIRRIRIERVVTGSLKVCMDPPYRIGATKIVFRNVCLIAVLIEREGLLRDLVGLRRLQGLSLIHI